MFAALMKLTSFSLVYFCLITNAEAFTLNDRSFNGRSTIRPYTVSKPHPFHSPHSFLKMSKSVKDTDEDESMSVPPPPINSMESLQSIKDNLVRSCEATSANKDTILKLVRELEDMGEQVSRICFHLRFRL